MGRRLLLKAVVYCRILILGMLGIGSKLGNDGEWLMKEMKEDGMKLLSVFFPNIKLSISVCPRFWLVELLTTKRNSRFGERLRSTPKYSKRIQVEVTKASPMYSTLLPAVKLIWKPSLMSEETAKSPFRVALMLLLATWVSSIMGMKPYASAHIRRFVLESDHILALHIADWCLETANNLPCTTEINPGGASANGICRIADLGYGNAVKVAIGLADA